MPRSSPSGRSPGSVAMLRAIGFQLITTGEVVLHDDELPFKLDRDLDDRRQDHDEGAVLLAPADRRVEGLDDLGRAEEPVEVPEHQDRRPVGRGQGVQGLDRREWVGGGGRQRLGLGRR